MKHTFGHLSMRQPVQEKIMLVSRSKAEIPNMFKNQMFWGSAMFSVGVTLTGTGTRVITQMLGLFFQRCKWPTQSQPGSRAKIAKTEIFKHVQTAH